MSIFIWIALGILATKMITREPKPDPTLGGRLIPSGTTQGQILAMNTARAEQHAKWREILDQEREERYNHAALDYARRMRKLRHQFDPTWKLEN